MSYNHPTSADYAKANANNAHDKIKELEATVEWMAAKLGLEIPRKPVPSIQPWQERLAATVSEHMRNSRMEQIAITEKGS